MRAVTRWGTGDVPEDVEQVAADVGTPEDARLACEGAAVVYHCAQPPYTKWAELFRPLTDAILASAAGSSSSCCSRRPGAARRSGSPRGQ